MGSHRQSTIKYLPQGKNLEKIGLVNPNSLCSKFIFLKKKLTPADIQPAGHACRAG